MFDGRNDYSSGHLARHRHALASRPKPLQSDYCRFALSELAPETKTFNVNGGAESQRLQYEREENENQTFCHWTPLIVSLVLRQVEDHNQRRLLPLFG